MERRAASSMRSLQISKRERKIPHDDVPVDVLLPSLRCLVLLAGLVVEDKKKTVSLVEALTPRLFLSLLIHIYGDGSELRIEE